MTARATKARKAPRAQFEYGMGFLADAKVGLAHKAAGHWALLIVDLCIDGTLSVTNDIEAVLQEIEQQRPYTLAMVNVYYRDSVGQWDQVHTDVLGKFVAFEFGGDTLARYEAAWTGVSPKHRGGK